MSSTRRAGTTRSVQSALAGQAKPRPGLIFTIWLPHRRIIEGMTVNKMYPRLVVSDGARAIDFYITALGATETDARSPDGKIVHAELRVGPAMIAVKDADEFDPAPRR